MMNELTNEEYWERSWGNIKLPQRVDLSFSNDHAIAQFLIENVPNGYGEKTALEVGCAPGKWMVFLKDYFDYIPHGCEFVHSAAMATKRNLTLCGIPRSKIHEGDFTTYDFGEQKYDLVVSFGFIEHFNKPNAIISKMKYLLKPNGILIIGIPNFNGLNYYFAKGAGYLSDHNRRVMRIGYLKSIPLTPISIKHVGGFEPGMYDITDKSLLYKMLYYGSIVTFSNPIARFLSEGWYSSYIMAAYKNTPFF